MPTILYTHPLCIEHDTGSYHPECSDRLRAVMKGLEAEEFQILTRATAPKAKRSEIERVHPAHYVEKILESAPASGHIYLDPDTVMSPKSGEAALVAAGAMCAAVDDVMEGRARNAFCAVRPPGHHAEHNAAMGFCLFNNVAIGALHAKEVYGLNRVAVVDFDVHHGNGTADIFDRYRDFFYASSHQSPCYPGTGAERDHGIHNNLVHVELAPGSGSEAFRTAYSERIFPALREWRPEFLFISAGFDAHARDPLAFLRLTTEDYAWVTHELMAIANDQCHGRVVSTLEGGYDLDALAASTAAHVRELIHA